MIWSEGTGKDVAVAYDKKDVALIAAAPELLEACKAALLMTDGANPAHEAIHRQVNAAITKAEGRD
jgi:hypothetical protein